MTKNEKILLIAGSAVLIGLVMFRKQAYNVILKWFLPEWESFSAVPYWDNKQWSWGYGTRAPNGQSSGTITRDQALNDMLAHVDQDHSYLQGLVKRNLSPSQWAALLSFSYNLGPGNADNLIQNINSGNDAALATQWAEYINSNGKPNEDLRDRRAAEWQFWIS